MSNIDKDPKFIKAFWQWFDSLPVDKKEFYWNLKADMAKIYFYNKFYLKMVKDADSKRIGI
jgi:alanine-alpha-ketoisovalerate/valine-pyruvate aminotransferase